MLPLHLPTAVSAHCPPQAVQAQPIVLHRLCKPRAITSSVSSQKKQVGLVTMARRIVSGRPGENADKQQSTELKVLSTAKKSEDLCCCWNKAMPQSKQMFPGHEDLHRLIMGPSQETEKDAEKPGAGV